MFYFAYRCTRKNKAMTELSNKLESNFEKITNLMKENITIFNKGVDWRKKAFGSLLAQLNQYDDAIKDTIGLRLQERLTKKQAKIVSSCKAIHRDISLNF